MKKIVLDAGHGLYTPGKRTPDGKYKEWTLNNNVANYIEDFLRGYDVQIVRTDDRTGNIDIPLEERWKKTKQENPDAIVSIHHNAYQGTFGNHTGVEVYTYTNGNAKSKQLANIIAPKLSEYTGLKNRGVRENQYYIISLNKDIPRVLVEGGFMDSNIDYPVITSIQGQQAYARAVAESLIQVLGLKNTTQVTPQVQVEENSNGQKMIVTANILNIRKGPSTSYPIVGKIYKNEVYTIVAKENNFGLLKSRVGWVSLDYMKPYGNSMMEVITYDGNSIVDALNTAGIDSSFTNRKRISELNGLSSYVGSADQNVFLLGLFKAGKLKY